MYVDFAIWFNSYVATLQEPTKEIVLLSFYVGLPLLYVFLYCLDKKIEEKKIYRGDFYGK